MVPRLINSFKEEREFAEQEGNEYKIVKLDAADDYTAIIDSNG